jgi:hypothetical protein
MDDALLAIKALESNPGILLSGEDGLLTSGHLILEIVSRVAARHGIPQYAYAISFEDLLQGVRSGNYPQINSVIPPVFGYPGADQGGLISGDPNVRKFAVELIEEALLCNLQLWEEGLGQGITIVWPAYMSLAALECAPDFLINNELLMQSPQWILFCDGVCEALQDVKNQTGQEVTIHFEWKVNDPGLIDVIPTLFLAMEMAKQINKEVGWQAVFINNEWAHLGLAGIGFIDGTFRTIKGGMFDRLVHVNGGTIHTESLESWMEGDPFHPTDWPALLDPDWPVGFGSERQYAEQAGAIALLAKYSEETGSLVILEHDVFHAPAIVPLGSHYGTPGKMREPFDVLVPSVLAANQMWETALANQK